jgi:hypothetical protein
MGFEPRDIQDPGLAASSPGHAESTIGVIDRISPGLQLARYVRRELTAGARSIT